MGSPIKLQFVATIHRPGSTPFRVMVSGRVAWAILSLIAAGPKGCTPITRPAPRWSDYVFKARAIGFTIETIHEGHDGTFAGHHGRYVLHDAVTASGGTLAEYLASPDGRREFGGHDFGFGKAVA